MADEDEIDILGDFSLNSCLSKNNQGIPSCSDLLQDTVHPQWLLDSTTSCWYDSVQNDMYRLSRQTPGSTSSEDQTVQTPTLLWTIAERQLLAREMAKYGRNVKKISETLTTKTEAEIQALIEAEHGINLDDKFDNIPGDLDGVPNFVQEEIVANDDNPGNYIDSINLLKTGVPTIPIVPEREKKEYKKAVKKSKHSLLRPDVLKQECSNSIDAVYQGGELFYEDDFLIAGTESVGSVNENSSDVDLLISSSKQSKRMPVKVKKAGNHRRKRSTSNSKVKSKFNISLKMGKKGAVKLKAKQIEAKMDGLVRSPRMQIVTGSGQAVPLSEGEQVIKINKKKSSDSESDIEVDIDSDENDNNKLVIDTSVKLVTHKVKQESQSAPVTTPEKKVKQVQFEPIRKRHRKINLQGDGGYTIMHTASGDLYQISTEPRKERAPRKQHVNLIQCRLYNTYNPAPYEVALHVSALIAMDLQAHTSRAEVMGLLGGALCPRASGAVLELRAYRPCRAAAGRTHCDMCPVSQAAAAEALSSDGHSLAGWHHSHPRFPPAPSATDLRTQRALQAALERPHAPFLGIITSQHWPRGRTASQYRCIRVEGTEDSEVGYQFSVKLIPDLTESNLTEQLDQLARVLREERADHNEFTVDMTKEVCPDAQITYLEKCLSSTSHHLTSAGYTQEHPVFQGLLRGIRDIFR